MQLYIGNKNYSSWSMRPWVLLRHFDIPFDEVMLRFDSMDAGSVFKQAVGQVSPAGRVPVLLDNGLAVWDTLAIAEYLADGHPALPLWPADRRARARSRSLCAEMHSGFGALRAAFPMNIEARLPEVGARELAARPAAQSDLQRIVAMWTDALATSGGPFLFGAFGIADAYFAPVVSRIRTYALPVPAAVAAYGERVWANPAVTQWAAQALEERQFVAFDEPYRSQR